LQRMVLVTYVEMCQYCDSFRQGNVIRHMNFICQINKAAIPYKTIISHVKSGKPHPIRIKKPCWMDDNVFANMDTQASEIAGTQLGKDHQSIKNHSPSCHKKLEGFLPTDLAHRFFHFRDLKAGMRNLELGSQDPISSPVLQLQKHQNRFQFDFPGARVEGIFFVADDTEKGA